jgi:ABC-2 type transport system ATP-binding protein
VSAISVEHVTKRFGEVTAVDDVSFDVPAGQLLAMLGPNGAGKSTTIEMLEGFIAPTAGTIRVLGADPRRGGRDWRARIGLVLQSTSLDGELTVRGALGLFAAMYPNPRPVAEVLEMIDLAADAATRIGTLSGGQRRRVDIALGVIGQPEVLFLDEPTTGLDPEARRHTWAGIENMATMGTTVLLTTHYIEEANQLADRVMVVSSGQILADTTPRQLRSSGGSTTIRWPMTDPRAVADLPAGLGHHIDPHENCLVIATADVTTTLRQVVSWAERNHLDLTGLEVGQPSLEDAYLTILDQQCTREEISHA